ncbi:MAG: hypothetical protein J6W84_07035 [Bacteroidales bacterium]|nr:hypothetical protein [Bacteroidales bacterium]
MANKKIQIKKCLYDGDPPTTFGMIPTDLITNPEFIKLPFAARCFFLTLLIFKESPEQRSELEKTMKIYNQLGRLPFGRKLSELEIKEMSYPTRRSHIPEPDKNFFVFPARVMEQHGFKRAYCSKMFAELELRGWVDIITPKSDRKQKYFGTQKIPCIYRFSGRWKKLKKEPKV